VLGAVIPSIGVEPPVGLVGVGIVVDSGTGAVLRFRFLIFLISCGTHGGVVTSNCCTAVTADCGNGTGGGVAVGLGVTGIDTTGLGAGATGFGNGFCVGFGLAVTAPITVVGPCCGVSNDD
jgi:hypothetical protein